jgi:hypothetical protein
VKYIINVCILLGLGLSMVLARKLFSGSQNSLTNRLDVAHTPALYGQNGALLCGHIDKMSYLRRGGQKS